MRLVTFVLGVLFGVFSILTFQNPKRVKNKLGDLKEKVKRIRKKKGAKSGRSRAVTGMVKS